MAALRLFEAAASSHTLLELQRMLLGRPPLLFRLLRCIEPDLS